MAIGTTLIIVLLIVAAIWIFVEVKRFRHKAVAILLILLILFTYISFVATIKGKNIDLKTMSGIKQAGKLYLSWVGSVFGNVKTLTSNAIHMEWGANKTKTQDNLKLELEEK